MKSQIFWGDFYENKGLPELHLIQSLRVKDYLITHLFKDDDFAHHKALVSRGRDMVQLYTKVCFNLICASHSFLMYCLVCFD